MERLTVTTTGSTLALRKALLPMGFAEEVMLLIDETWRSFSMHPDVKWEESITALFSEALIDAYEEKGWPWMITSEGQINDLTFGIQLARNDLRFHRHDVKQRKFFTVECKRLHVRTDSGFKHLADEYVNEGLLRFAAGKYGAGQTCGGMLGYVMDNQVATAFTRVTREITSENARLRIMNMPFVSSPSRVLPDNPHSADTVHQRDDDQFLVHHLLVGISQS